MTPDAMRATTYAAGLARSTVTTAAVAETISADGDAKEARASVSLAHGPRIVISVFSTFVHFRAEIMHALNSSTCAAVAPPGMAFETTPKSPFR